MFVVDNIHTKDSVSLPVITQCIATDYQNTVLFQRYPTRARNYMCLVRHIYV